jgi:serine/threonine protein phosphatase PrpC
MMFARNRDVPINGAAGMSGSRAFAQNSMLDVEFAELSDVGRVRDHNEDYTGHFAPVVSEQVRSHGWLFALADGVGGQAKGEVASRTAIESLLAGFEKAAVGEIASNLLQRLVQKANTCVYEAGSAMGPGGSSIATTLVACLLRHDRAAVAHVGDSRCYLIRRGQATLLTRDHTVVGEQVRLGLISAKEAATAETRHILSRSLGHDLFVNVEISEHQLLAGDVLLLCCDGLHGSVTGQEMAAAVTAHQDLNEGARELVALANEKDGSDNISVQLIRIRNVERVGMYRGRPYRLR